MRILKILLRLTYLAPMLSLASDAPLFHIEQNKLTEIAMRSLVNAAPNLEKSELAVSSILVHCTDSQDSSCIAIVSIRIASESELSRESRRCIEKITFKEVQVTVFATGEADVQNPDAPNSGTETRVAECPR